MDLANKVKDLEFLLRREKLESKARTKEILYQVLEVQEGLERLLDIASRQDWPEEARLFVQERFSLVSKRLLHVLQRSGAMQINSLGQPVNQEYQEVVGKIERRDLPEGQVVQVEREGFVYEGEVLRMARVVVSARQ